MALIIIPKLLYQICLIIIMGRCAYVGFKLLKHTRKDWLEIAFYFSVVIVGYTLL